MNVVLLPLNKRQCATGWYPGPALDATGWPSDFERGSLLGGADADDLSAIERNLPEGVELKELVGELSNIFVFPDHTVPTEKNRFKDKKSNYKSITISATFARLPTMHTYFLDEEEEISS